MTVTNISKDPAALTMRVSATFDAPIERVWQIWEDPRQLEKWWGPPTWPATFEALDMTPGGRGGYYMTGPEGEKVRGWWKFIAVDAPRSFQIEDGFADDDGNPNLESPITLMRVDLEPREGGGTNMTILSTFASLEQMEQLIAMGMEEGLKAAMGQIDALLERA